MAVGVFHTPPFWILVFWVLSLAVSPPYWQGAMAPPRTAASAPAFRSFAPQDDGIARQMVRYAYPTRQLASSWWMKRPRRMHAHPLPHSLRRHSASGPLGLWSTWVAQPCCEN